MAKRGRKPKKVEEVEVKDKKVKTENVKEKKVKEKEIEVQEELFKDDDFEVEDNNSFEEYDDEEDEVISEINEEEKEEEVIVINNATNDLKNIKFISIVSLCVSVVTLILTLVILNNVSGKATSQSEKGSSDSSSEEVLGYDVSKFKSITDDEFIDMFDDEDETYFVYTGRSTCGYCVQFVPVLNKSIEEYDYTVHYLDVSKVGDDAYETIIELDDELESNFGYTPMVFVVRDGEVVDVNEGYSEYESYQKFLEDNDVVKK